MSIVNKTFYKFWIIYPADFSFCIHGNLSGVLQVPDDRGIRLVHHFLGQVLPECPLLVLPAVFPDERFYHEDSIQLRGMCSLCGGRHEQIVVI